MQNNRFPGCDHFRLRFEYKIAGFFRPVFRYGPCCNLTAAGHAENHQREYEALQDLYHLDFVSPKISSVRENGVHVGLQRIRKVYGNYCRWKSSSS